MSVLDIDAHLLFVDRNGKDKLGANDASELAQLLTHEPMVTFQRGILQVINGQLNRLASLKLGDPTQLAEASKVQGTIAGLRMFWELAAEMIQEAERKDADQQ